MIAKIDTLCKFLIAVILIGFASGCVKPIDIEADTYENALVVEGTITNELSYQEIFLSRTYSLEEKGPAKESNAQIRVVSNSDVHEFQETEPGKYVSVQPFKALQNVEYRLEINTSNGRQYSSEIEKLPESSEISSLYAQKVTIEGEEGLAILADVNGPEGSSGFFKYNYQETYKIVSPFTSMRDLYVIDDELVQVIKTKEETTCYVTEGSSEIILANTNEQAQNNIDRLLIKFMDKESFKTAHRYSILVKQLSLSEEAYSYYETLQDFSESESLFTQNQLGLINGNIISQSDPDEAVVGVFSLAAVTVQRIFFDFEDFYNRNDFRPDAHVKECEAVFPPTGTAADREVLRESLATGRLKYLGFDVQKGYRFVRAACIDCTVFGTNVPPEFWEE
ncbi:DUF4249 domain-containing protein [Salinimicrobium sediminilitoris]|uniref:DUF4249 domain-containing protein n=1 Tax=Salinimicrobium sediminilitoris TaxID=2876715 RepID=UPI001E4E6398|nr:DUF4249 domain-containing protein [Salinimicrobium sediminilitoris]MCC8361382.1 DUF4249 domain-containing protein [Salinimicrobium sediminilitoris]